MDFIHAFGSELHCTDALCCFGMPQANLASTNRERQRVAARCVGDLVSKLGRSAAIDAHLVMSQGNQKRWYA